MKHIVSFSGGKDSAAMLLMMIEHGMKIDEIIFCNIMATDTIGAELPETYEYIEYIEKYIGIPIKRIYPKNTYEEIFYSVKKRGKHIGETYGFPHVIGAWCNGRLKMQAINKYYSSIKDDFIVYVGIAADEPKRIARLKQNQRAPLNELGITENEAKQYLMDRGLLNPLYEKYDRLGCWFCNKASIKSLRVLYSDYSEYWEILKKWEKDSRLTFKPNKSIIDLESRFLSEKNQLSLF